MLYSMRSVPEFFSHVTGFEWDEGNSEKNWHRHGVSRVEIEQIFLNRPIVVAGDPKHSDKERRFFALGHTDMIRLLAVVFTLQGSMLCVISARTMSRRERRVYAQAEAAEGSSPV
jgi:uncharacterized DUF497 family protein